MSREEPLVAKSKRSVSGGSSFFSRGGHAHAEPEPEPERSTSFSRYRRSSHEQESTKHGMVFKVNHDVTSGKDAGPHSTLLQRSAEIHGVQELAGDHGHEHHHAHHSHHDALEGKKNKVMMKLVDAVEKSKRKRRDTNSDQRTGSSSSSSSLPRKQP